MKNFLFAFAAAAFFPAALMAQEKINPTDPQPSCAMCPGTLVPLAELEAYAKKAIAEKLVDQQVRDIDIGKARRKRGECFEGLRHFGAILKRGGDRGTFVCQRTARLDPALQPRQSARNLGRQCLGVRHRGVPQA